MGYSSLRQCVEDLEQSGRLRRVTEAVDPYLEMAAIQRRVYEAEGPAVLFEQVKGSPFPAVCNIFGTIERCRYLFRDSLERVKRVIQIKADPANLLRSPSRFLASPWTALKALPMSSPRAPVLDHQTSIAELPQIQSWPDDGGPFITLPQVLTQDPDQPGPLHTNLGMYRAQMSGNDYLPGKEIGLHFQIHRGIGVHYAKAAAQGKSMPVSIFVGGPPAHTLAAVMPLPEGLTELLFAGMLGNRRFRYSRRGDHLISSDADFCILGRLNPGRNKPEGPFGDHLGYYSLVHDFPVFEVEAVFHRPGAIWPFTVVGRPPQEDTSFGKLIHELTAPMVPREIPGLHEMHAVDAAGVHPLLLAIGSERYTPYAAERCPQEILTIANAVLGFGQASLAKYLFICAREDAPDLSTADIEGFLRHMLERVDFRRDLHFQTRTTIDTLDYSGSGLHEGSKLVVAAAGDKRRTLSTSIPENLTWPEAVRDVRMAFPGVLVLQLDAFEGYDEAAAELAELTQAFGRMRYKDKTLFDGHPLFVLADDAEFTAANLSNFLWVTFTRSNPSHDVRGVESWIEQKHWGCPGPLIIDARIKPQHAPPLIEDPAITARVEQLAAPGGPLHGVF